ncbi:MAG: phospho-N-acetylmuramoyl-pentapeptide-transferase [Clostridiales bacterium]|jgi:phospho-N-acetylmuramoyl-pentapeptide-transferase|nr:phospho-N-acetylmuramoyl-pentapeptide-transferase [Clostridiales bacterium]
MSEYKNLIIILLAALAAFAVSMLISPFVIKITERIKAGQPILKYLEHHEKKVGTPTMGGFIFIIPAALITLSVGYNRLSLVAVLTAASYGIVGFLDDFIKVRRGMNEGLKPYQKVVGQLGIAVIATLFAYYNDGIGTSVKVPFSVFEVDLGIWFIPFSIFVFVAVTNSVNLTDGIDGLAGGSGAAAFAAFSAAGILYYLEAAHYGAAAFADGLFSLAVFSAVFSCSLLGFLWKNAGPSRIFMGDTGSLAIGGGLAAAAIFMRNPLILPIVCAVYVWSSVSVILQVAFFKAAKRRIFKMSPFHHHLELKGYSEAKITTFYTVVTIAAGLVGIISVILNLS